MDELGKGFDQRVLEWKADAESSMNAMVSIMIINTCTCIYLHLQT